MKYCQVESTRVVTDSRGNDTCENCGWSLSEDWTFCPNCGRFIDWDEVIDETED